MKSLLNHFFQQEPEPVHCLMHFSYHKCMTNLFVSVLGSLAYHNGWYHKHHNAVLSGFLEDVRNRKGYRFISVNNVPVDFDRINVPYLGTHLVRDPRDLILSGYRYHLWCREKWTQEPMSDDFRMRIRLKEIDSSLDSGLLTYQELLNKVDVETGLLIEYYWRFRHLVQMNAWNYQNPNILELKYESVFEHETELFEKILRFYQLPESVVQAGIMLAQQYSFAERKASGETGEGKHVSKGIIRQWESELPASLKNLVSVDFSDLLIKLGYQTQ